MDSDCIVCRMRQALDMCRFVDAKESVRQEVLQTTMELLVKREELEQSADVGVLIYEKIKQILNLDDPYKSVKTESIRTAINILPRLKEIVRNSDTPLRTATELCIAGNVIDFGPSNSHNIEKSIDEVLISKKHRFDWDSFSAAIQNAKTILILADNAGETVIDRILINEINVPILYAVKSKPVLNDAILEDAIASGLDNLVELIENGSPLSGTVLSRCSSKFLDIYSKVDMVISKGQANFETLAKEDRQIFFLFKVKCELLSRKHEIPINEYVLMDNQLQKRCKIN
jgi:damage-control phosphatase, subfamily I